MYVIPLARDKKHISSLMQILKVYRLTTTVDIDNALKFNKILVLFYRAAIDVFFAARVARKNCLRPSACICG